MKRFVYKLLIVVFAVTSCGKNGLYINVNNTAWEISSNTQVGWPCFLDDQHVSVIQVNNANGYYQVLNGTFSVKGHRVDVTADGTSLYMVRTFSNLKNSSNKNYRKLSPEAPEALDGSVWACLKDNDFTFYYFQDNGTCRKGTYQNVSHREGFDDGWSFSNLPYTASGSHFSTADGEGYFYGNAFLRLDSVAVPFVSTPENKDGTSSLKGTVWTYNSGSAYPGFILFTSAKDFTRILVGSNVIFAVLTGTYEIKGDSVAFQTEAAELCETCPIEDGQFTYLKKTYSLEENISFTLGQ